MSGPPPDDETPDRPKVDVSRAQGVQLGDDNAQTNIITNIFPGKDTRPPVITAVGTLDSPYLGLQAFGEDEAGLFFGRETAAAQILERIERRTREPGILVISGVSGAGKSSLLRAGVIPRVTAIRAAQAPETASRSHVVLTPTRHPLQELATSLAPLAGTDATALLGSLRDDPGALALTARSITTIIPNAPSRLLIVIDQFEEVFTQCQDPAERSRYIAALHAAATMRTGPDQEPAALVVLVVRADFEARCAEYEELTDAVQDRYLLTPMTQRQLRLAITRPAEIAKARVDDALVDALVEEARSGPSAGLLPHLSYALDQAWRDRAQDDVLNLDDYERTGGIEGSVAAGADRAFATLTGGQQKVAQQVFMRLVTTSSDLVVSAGRATRDEVAAGAPAEDVNAVIEAFAAERLVTVGEDYVEISHEVLLTAWGQFQRWLDGDKIDMARYSHLAADARDWDAAGRSSSYLYSPGRLEEIAEAEKRWSADPGLYPPLAPVPRAFLAAARDAARWARRRRRGVTAVLTVLTLAAATAAGLAVSNASEANQQQSIALSRELAAESLNLSSTSPATALQLADAAWHTSPTTQAGSAMTKLLTDDDRAGQVPVALARGQDFALLLAVSPDGRFAADAWNTGSSVQLWNPQTSKTVRLLRAPVGEGDIAALTFSPDGKTLAAASGDDVLMWDVTTGKLVRTLSLPAGGYASTMRSISFSPDGGVIAGGDDDDLYLWNASTGRAVGKPIHAVSGESPAVADVAFSPDGKLLASAGSDGYVKVWNPATRTEVGQPISVMTKGEGSPDLVTSVAFSPSDGLLADADANGYVRLWHPLTGKPAGEPIPADVSATGSVNDVAFSPDGKVLASADGDGYVKLWSPVTGKETGAPLQADADGSPVEDVSFSAHSGLLAAAADDGAARLWAAASGLPVGDAMRVSVNAPYVSFSASASLLSADAEGYLAQLPATGLNSASSSPASDRWAVDGVDSYSPSGQMVTVDGTKLESRGAITRNLPAAPGKNDQVTATAFSPDGKLLATASGDGYVRLWNTATGALVHALPADQSALANVSIGFSPDGKLIATGNLSGQMAVWSTATGDRVRGPWLADPGSAGSGGGYIPSVAFNPAGNLIASADSDNGAVKLWQAATGRLTATLPSDGSNTATMMTFSPDGKLFAVGYIDGTIQLWSTATWTRIGAALPSSSSDVSTRAIEALSSHRTAACC